MSEPWHVLEADISNLYCQVRTGAKDYTEKHLSFQHQTFVRFLLPSRKHQWSVHSGASFSLRSLVCLMSHMAIVCLGLLCLWWAAVYADNTQREADRCQPHVLSFASALYLFLYCSTSLIHTTITGISFSIIASPVKSQQRSRKLCTEVLWRELALYILGFFGVFFAHLM